MKQISLLGLLVATLASGALARQVPGNDLSAPLDLLGYASELGRWSLSANRLREHPQEAAALRKQLPDHWLVAVEEQHFQVSTEWLGAALDRLSADPQLAADVSQEMSTRLESMLRDSQSLARNPGPKSSVARAKLDEILKRREYRSVRNASQAQGIWDQLADWTWKFINRLFSGVGAHPKVTRILLWGVVIALGMASLGWLIYSLANISFANLSFRRLQVPVQAAAPAGSWQELVRQARTAAANGEYRHAVRIIYGAAVRRIEETGTWRVDPARTHREFVRLLPANSPQRPPLAAIATCYERVWYGQVDASAVDYDAVLAELERLR